MEELILGPEEQFETLPAEVEIKRHPYYLVRNEEGLQLVSRICPHAGYLVDMEAEEYYCPLHGWTFDLKTGKCLNVRFASLNVFPVIIRDGQLVAQIGE